MTKKTMIKKCVWHISAIMLISLLLNGGQAHADNATILPKGYGQVLTETFFFKDITHRYDSNGNKVRLDAPFNAPLAPLLGLPSPADLGSTVVKLKLEQNDIQFTPAFGVTNRLTIGAIIPILHQSTKVQTLAIDLSSANFGINGAPCGMIGCGAPGDVPVTVAAVQSVLQARGFKPVKNWDRTRLADIDVGGRYQYHRSEKFRAAFTGGLRIPTGTVDDPDNLIDRGSGTGAWAMLFQFQQDALFSERAKEGNIQNRLGFPTPGSFYINTDIRYELFFPHHETLRVCAPTNPICTTKANLKRNLGNVIRANLAPVIGLMKGFILTPEYRFRYKFKDSFNRPGGINTSVLEKDSDLESHEMKVILAFTTLPWVVEKKFPIPMVVSFTWRDRVAGRNVLDSQFFGFNVRIYGK